MNLGLYLLYINAMVTIVSSDASASNTNTFLLTSGLASHALIPCKEGGNVEARLKCDQWEVVHKSNIHEEAREKFI